MRNFLLFSLLFVFPGLLYSQEFEVPEKIYFAGMELQLSRGARKKLQTEVENLRRNPKYFQMKVDRANLYFPLIEKVFEEENFPDDFKYLALQESALVSDAVSSSNAVGYWQFKKESATEVGLRINNLVDERMNIIASSRGAAKYLKKNNAVLNNWIYALLSYNLGLGGVKSKVDSKYIGVRAMKINDHMHWYVLKFLGHKLAFETAVGGHTSSGLQLLEYPCSGKHLNRIAGNMNLSQEDVSNYNKWALKGQVPSDQPYSVILPVKKEQQTQVAQAIRHTHTKSDENPAKQTAKSPNRIKAKRKRGKAKQTNEESVNQHVALITVHNKLKAIRAKTDDTFEELAAQGGIRFDNFLLYNELKRYGKPETDAYYYLEPKRNRAIVFKHVVHSGETLWDIGQKYGVRTNALRKKNRLGMKEEPEMGRVILLRSRLKKREKPQFENVSKKPEKVAYTSPVKVQKSETVENPTKLKQHTASKQKENPIQTNASSPSTQEPPEHYRYHFVEPGETLYGLGKQYDISTDSLVLWNSLGPEGLKAGQNIIVGKNAGEIPLTPSRVVYHTVKAGETLYSIAKKYGKTVSQLMETNSKTDFSVSVGEKLKITTE